MKNYITLLCSLAIIFTVALTVIFTRNNLTITNKTDNIEIDKCYSLEEENPFEKHIVVIKIRDIKQGYALYNFASTPEPEYATSNDIQTLKRIFYETDCKYFNNKGIK